MILIKVTNYWKSDQYHVFNLDQLESISHFDNKTEIRLLSGRVLQSLMSASEIHALILEAQQQESLLESRVKDLEIENQDLRDRLAKVVAPVYKYKSRLDGMREDAAALVESVILDPEKIKECHFGS